MGFVLLFSFIGASAAGDEVLNDWFAEQFSCMPQNYFACDGGMQKQLNVISRLPFQVYDILDPKLCGIYPSNSMCNMSCNDVL